MKKKKIHFSLVLRILSLVIAFIIINICFVVYIYHSNLQLVKNNKYFLESYSNQKLNSINMVLNNGLEFTQNIASLYSTELSTSSLNKYKLQRMMQNTNFTYMRYINRQGKCICQNGDIYDDTESEMYINGLNGKSGIVFETKLSPKGEKMRYISFYAPIYYLKFENGVLVCSYEADEIIELLEGEICEEAAGCILVDKNLDIVLASSKVPQTLVNLKQEFGEYDLEKIGEKQFVDVYSSKDPTFGERLLHQVKQIVYIAPIEQMDWIFIQEFPAAAMEKIAVESMQTGTAFMFEIILAFIIYIIGVAVYHYARYFLTLKSNIRKNYIVQGISKVFSKFVLLDFETGQYEYLESTSSEIEMQRKGPFIELINFLIRVSAEEEAKNYYKEVLEPGILIKHLEENDSVFNFGLHVKKPHEYWETISIIAIEWKEGHVTKALVTNQQVTDMKRREERDRQALQEALHTAEHASRAKSLFLSNMSHDMRTPMNAIVGFSTLIDKEAEKPDRVREYIQKIKASSEHLLGIINDILDMSKIESGKAILNCEIFTMDELIEGIRDIIDPQMEKHGKKFEIRLSPLTFTSFNGDKVRISQILLNLLSNAIKYTQDDGHIILEISEQTRTQDKKYENIKFVVKDNGIGIDEEFKEHIFESFTRETNSLINKIQGTGLGMAITKNLVDLMNGTIRVESEKNKGSTFEVIIPMEIVKEAENKHKESTEYDENVLKGMKFLVAEDNEINYTVISSLLEMLGASSINAENGRIAVEKLKKSCKEDFDMIFMDVQMPQMDGLEATRAIRALDNEWARTIPIIAMTANVYAEDVANALNAGMNAHLAKPVDLEALIKTVKKLK